MTPLLSILICHMPSRQALLDRLLEEMHLQCSQSGRDVGKHIEILTDRSTQITTGSKRNNLLKKSCGKFIVFVDDDDMILSGYISKICAAIESDQEIDHIGISGYITTNGENRRPWHISSSFGSWYEKDGVYYRTPNHISPVRRDVAIKVGFTDKYHGEDYDYSMGILPLLKKEVRIKADLYHYNFNSK